MAENKNENKEEKEEGKSAVKEALVTKSSNKGSQQQQQLQQAGARARTKGVVAASVVAVVGPDGKEVAKNAHPQPAAIQKDHGELVQEKYGLAGRRGKKQNPKLSNAAATTVSPQADNNSDEDLSTAGRPNRNRNERSKSPTRLFGEGRNRSRYRPHHSPHRAATDQQGRSVSPTHHHHSPSRTTTNISARKAAYDAKFHNNSNNRGRSPGRAFQHATASPQGLGRSESPKGKRSISPHRIPHRATTAHGVASRSKSPTTTVHRVPPRAIPAPSAHHTPSRSTSPTRTVHRVPHRATTAPNTHAHHRGVPSTDLSSRRAAYETKFRSDPSSHDPNNASLAVTHEDSNHATTNDDPDIDHERLADSTAKGAEQVKKDEEINLEEGSSSQHQQPQYLEVMEFPGAYSGDAEGNILMRNQDARFSLLGEEAPNSATNHAASIINDEMDGSQGVVLCMEHPTDSPKEGDK